MDLAEAESELTAGFFTEHSSTIFVFFFLAEYANIIIISCLQAIFFLGGYLSPISLEFIPYLLSNTDNSNIFYNIILNFSYGIIFGIKVILIIFLFI
jgi:NADH:ubiquinone oxidoreductase subunit H